MKDPKEPKPAPLHHVMPSRFATAYDQNRDRFYGLERNPYTGKVEDCRDRD
jgi:hypothetical protein